MTPKVYKVRASHCSILKYCKTKKKRERQKDRKKEKGVTF